jgi:hypothetical protein
MSASASARRTIDSDNITLRTVFARGTSNTVIPSSFVLTADGRGGTYWSTPYTNVPSETISSVKGNILQFSTIIATNIYTSSASISSLFTNSALMSSLIASSIYIENASISSIASQTGTFSTLLASTSYTSTLFANVASFSTASFSTLNANSATISSLAVNVGLFSTILGSTLTTSTLFANVAYFSSITSYTSAFSSILTSTVRTSTLTVNSAAYVSSLVIKTQSNTMTYPMPCGQVGIVNTSFTTINNPLLTSLSIILVTPASSAYSGNYYVSAFSGYFTITISTTPVITQYFNYAVVSY